MSEIVEISVEIPDSLDSPSLRLDLAILCRKEIDSRIQAIERDREMQEVLESDGALAKWVASYWYRKPPPYTRASSYKRPDYRQEIGEFWHSRFQSDPRRPVIMRGAVAMLQGKYNIKSGYCEDVVERYLRRIRFTSVDREEINNMLHSAFQRAMRLYEHHRHYGERDAVYIDGERKHLNEEELAAAKKLYAMVQKVSKLETRIKKGIEHAT